MSGGATLPLGSDVGMASSKAVFAAHERYPDFLELNRATRPVVHRLARRSTRDRYQAARTSSPSAQAPEGV